MAEKIKRKTQIKSSYHIVEIFARRLRERKRVCLFECINIIKNSPFFPQHITPSHYIFSTFKKTTHIFISFDFFLLLFKSFFPPPKAFRRPTRLLRSVSVSRHNLSLCIHHTYLQWMSMDVVVELKLSRAIHSLRSNRIAYIAICICTPYLFSLDLDFTEDANRKSERKKKSLAQMDFWLLNREYTETIKVVCVVCMR